MTTNQRDDAEMALRGLKTGLIRGLERETGKTFAQLLEEAGVPTGDGLMSFALALESKKNPDATFEELLELAEDWTLDDYAELELAEGVEIDLRKPASAENPPFIDIERSAS